MGAMATYVRAGRARGGDRPRRPHRRTPPAGHQRPPRERSGGAHSRSMPATAVRRRDAGGVEPPLSPSTSSPSPKANSSSKGTGKKSATATWPGTRTGLRRRRWLIATRRRVLLRDTRALNWSETHDVASYRGIDARQAGAKATVKHDRDAAFPATASRTRGRAVRRITRPDQAGHGPLACLPAARTLPRRSHLSR